MKKIDSKTIVTDATQAIALLERIINWMRQPSSVVGMSAILGGVTSLLNGDRHSAFVMILSGVAAVVIPDNTIHLSHPDKPTP